MKLKGPAAATVKRGRGMRRRPSAVGCRCAPHRRTGRERAKDVNGLTGVPGRDSGRHGVHPIGM